MALFVVNRYLGEEVDVSAERSKALLQKLHEQAKVRQQQIQKLKEKESPKISNVFPKDTEIIIEAQEETPRKSKKRKKKHVEDESVQTECPSVENKQEDKIQETSNVKKHNKKEVCEVEEQVDTDTLSKHPEHEECSTEDPSSFILGGFEPKSVQKVHIIALTSFQVLPVLPQWLAQPSLVQNNIKQNLVSIYDVPGLHPKILKKLEANNIKTFFPVQAEVIPAILGSTYNGFLLGKGGYRPNDICVSAPTGSGKTLAFVIPIIQALQQRVVCEVRALVVLPTKELAQQVCKVFNIYVDGTGLKVVMLTGQRSFAKEQEGLVQKTAYNFSSLADIVVCTPGRLVDHIQQTEGFILRHLRFLVIDEADRMIDTMNQDWLHHVTKAVFKVEAEDTNLLFSRKEPVKLTVASCCKPQTPLQKLLFSATLTQNPEKLQQLGLYQPKLFTATKKDTIKRTSEDQTEPSSSLNYSLPEGLTHYYIPCNLNSKPLILLHFLLTLRFSRVLCFTNSRDASHR
ncbi:hypothetical protein GDO86_001895 [Hymenochirus boettgeri]|uniref:ATP-dependent RNA helicase n=1 Tax=Hymenochirus boettgeri TaxID=247094 RepID=A0A8T2KIX3_9PIPI|nr:hypothetical protein GDO86_001895 [Hymenochirus boettgeri]